MTLIVRGAGSILRHMYHVFGLIIPSAGYKQDFFHTRKGCAFVTVHGFKGLPAFRDAKATRGRWTPIFGQPERKLSSKPVKWKRKLRDAVVLWMDNCYYDNLLNPCDNKWIPQVNLLYERSPTNNRRYKILYLRERRQI